MGEKEPLVKFEPQDMEKAFEELAKRFYRQNFGQMSKADFEALMFHFYMKKLVEQYQNSAGVLDYNKCSDYKISQELGITQQRVANLKVKSQLLYPIEFKWEDSFASLIENARFDRQSKKIIVPIPDPNLYYKIQNFLEEQGGYIEVQLNKKLLQMRVEYYIALLEAVLGNEDSKRKIIENLKKKVEKDNQLEKKFDEKDIGRSLLNLGGDLTAIIEIIQCILLPETALGKAFSALIHMLKL